MRKLQGKVLRTLISGEGRFVGKALLALQGGQRNVQPVRERQADFARVFGYKAQV